MLIFGFVFLLILLRDIRFVVLGKFVYLGRIFGCLGVFRERGKRERL